MGLDQSPADGETQAKPAASTLLADLDIGLEDALAIVRRDARPLTGNADLDTRALGRALVGARHVAGRDFNGSARGRVLDRVDEQIGQDLSETGSIEARTIGAGIDLQPNFQLAVVEQWSKKRDDFVDHG